MSRPHQPFQNRNQKEPEFNINERIRAEKIRIVGENLPEISVLVGEEIEASAILPLSKALYLAEKAEMDLVEITPNANPPVCRIIDYSKFLYEKKKKEKEMKAKQVKTVLKEIRFSPNTDDHDFEFKAKHAKNFLEEGSKVKAYVQFKGRAIMYKERGEELLRRFIKELEDVGQLESPIKLEGKRMMIHLISKKKK